MKLEIPDGVKKIGLAMSGGVESSLLFYLLHKKIIDEDLNVTIHPLVLCHIDRKFINEIVHNIINLQESFPFVIKPYVYFSNFDRKYTTKNLNSFLNPIKRNVDIIARGTNRNPPIYVMPGDQDKAWELPEMDEFDEEWKPFKNMHKQDLALIYKMYDLKELFKLTVSCSNYYIDKRGFGIVCKKCLACYERKWAFKTFDNEWLL